MRALQVGLSLYPTDDACLAAYPLLEEGLVDALEWTVDVCFYDSEPPTEWTTTLLDRYAAAGRLYGHAVSLSPTTARFDDESRAWLAQLARTDTRRYRHVTDHWGFSRAGGVVRGAPMPLPAATSVVAATTTALRALGDVVRTQVGVENLALALSPDELASQPAMIARVLDAVDGALLFDLHNLWCQAVNFGRDPRELAALYPLHRVRQIHVAGGGWSESSYGAPVRRDTHDGWVPPEVLELLAWVVPRCPNLDVVILERIPAALADEATHEPWRDEWRRVREVVRRAAAEPLASVRPPPAVALDDVGLDDLARYQDAMVMTLLAASRDRTPATAAHAALLADPAIAPFRAQVERWEPRQLEVAIELVGKWSVVT